MNTIPQIIPDMVNMTTMARLLNLSRSRLYQLMEQDILLKPAYLLSNRKPVFTRDMALRNLQVKANNCGVNNQILLFYSVRNKTRKESTPKVRTSQPRKVASPSKYEALLDELTSLGIDDLTVEQVEKAVSNCFPEGSDNIDPDTLLKTLFCHLKRQNTEHNQGA
jgi:hypothetical protein